MSSIRKVVPLIHVCPTMQRNLLEHTFLRVLVPAVNFLPGKYCLKLIVFDTRDKIDPPNVLPGTESYHPCVAAKMAWLSAIKICVRRVGCWLHCSRLQCESEARQTKASPFLTQQQQIIIWFIWYKYQMHLVISQVAWRKPVQVASLLVRTLTFLQRLKGETFPVCGCQKRAILVRSYEVLRIRVSYLVGRKPGFPSH